VQPDLDALELAAGATNLNVSAGVYTVLGSLPMLEPFRERLARELPTFDLAGSDKLETYALALLYAQAAFQNAPPERAPAAADSRARALERRTTTLRSCPDASS
jgi:hypothetical protein